MVAALFLLLNKRFSRKQQIPFAPFLALGAVAAKTASFYLHW
jgi:prepilin signal peptidase PulO-like enzyme (type II secretory pathway)